MSKQQKTVFWIVLTLSLFAFFRWLFGLAIPEIALEFSLGTTLILVSGLAVGRAAVLVMLRSHAIHHPATANVFLGLFIFAGLLLIAFLLNAMVEKTTLFLFAVTILFVFLVAAASAGLFTNMREQYKAKVTSAQAAMAQSKSELQLLQSQLSPHFLFNTLNNLYGLSLSEAERIPPLLLKLSALLRYSVYDAKEAFVPIQDEIDYLKNYVEFEQLRLGERLQLKMEIDAQFDPDCKIPPLLLVVFVENAFKHSRNTKDKQVVIDIQLRKRDHYIIFLISNSTSAEQAHERHPDKHSGFGLESVRKRLGLLYAGKHTLDIRKTANNYEMELTLNCQ